MVFVHWSPSRLAATEHLSLDMCPHAVGVPGTWGKRVLSSQAGCVVSIGCGFSIALILAFKLSVQINLIPTVSFYCTQ